VFNCPVLNCDKEFYTKNSLANHIIKNIDPSHQAYYESNLKKKHCQRCGRGIDRRSLNQIVCYTCISAENNLNKKEVNKEFLSKICFKCGNKVEGLFSRRNTRVLCSTCKKESTDNKKRYNESFDKKRYAEAKVIRKLKKEERSIEINDQITSNVELIKDIKEHNVAIHKLLDKHSLSLAYFKKACLNIISDEEYRLWCKSSRTMAGLGLAPLHIKRWRERDRPASPIFNRVPNKLELQMAQSIKEKFPCLNLDNNQWRTLYSEDRKEYYHLEVDIVLRVEDKRICILCDGEAYHGKECFFRGDTVSEDDFRSKILFNYNPVVIRYSETEIKSGYAIDHLSGILSKLKDSKIFSYYRNWMTGEEKESLEYVPV
jgi:ribosomal protein S27E